MPAVYPAGPASGWSKHYHVDTAASPVWADFAPYLDHMPEALQYQIYTHISTREGNTAGGGGSLLGASTSPMSTAAVSTPPAFEQEEEDYLDDDATDAPDELPGLDAPPPEPEVTVFAGHAPPGGEEVIP